MLHRAAFLADGTLLLGVSHRIDEEAPQQIDSHIGKILRLTTMVRARRHPYFAVRGALPEIYNWGIRSAMDFVPIGHV